MTSLLRGALLVACTALVASPALAAEEDEPVTCAWVESHDTYYCETGTFDDLVSDCLITSDNDSCCVATAEPSICGSSQAQRPTFREVLTWAFGDRVVATFSKPHESSQQTYQSAD